MFSPARGRLGKSKGTGLHSPAPASPAVVSHLSHHPATPGALRGGLSPLFPRSSSSSIPPRTFPSLDNRDKAGIDGTQPVFVCNFPQQLRNVYVERALNRTDTGIYGGMDGISGLSWVLHGNSLFVWSHLNSRATQGCAVLTIPSEFSAKEGRTGDFKLSENWLVAIVGWRTEDLNDVSFVKPCTSAGVIMCHRKSLATVYWPDAFTDGDTSVVSLGPGDKVDGSSTPGVEENRLSARKSFSSWTGSTGAPGGELVNSLIASAVPGGSAQSCVVIAGRSNGELWRYDCCPLGITRQQITRDVVARQDMGLIAFNSSSARSMVWRFPPGKPEQGKRQLLLLTAAELECWNVELAAGGKVTEAWRFNILENPDTQKDFAGQKQVWLLDLQVDDSGNFFTVLVASFSKDRVNSSSFMQYSLLTFFDKDPPGGDVVRKAPMQVILPKARVEEEAVLYSMRLRIGGKPMGSAVILAGDGTSTIAHYSNGSLKLYHFDLAWGAGKVLDASVVPALEGDEGAWLVLTEKSGVWAVPEKAVILGGVEPPERSLSRRGSSIEDLGKEERQRGYSIEPRRVVSDTGAPESREIARSINQRPLHDEEAEAIVGRMFQQFLTSGRVDSALEKLERAGAFEREVEMNIFARTSRVIVDTLAKHWVAGGAGSAAIMAAVSSQLIEKQRRHQQYLNFLSISNCHDELQQKQRGALHAIMEHGEKLAAMVQLRELHNARAQLRLQSVGSFTESESGQSSEVSGALWDTIQLVGEKARRNNVMLMDREKSEVFYTRVSDLEEFFACIQQHGSSIIGQEQPVKIQVERLCEISEATTSIIRAAIRYRDTHSSWYPSPEGLTPWYCKPTVRSGVWKVATLIQEVKAEAIVSVPSLEPKLVSWLEVVADVLLEGYAGAITAKVEREEEYRGLQMEYWNRRDTLLSALQSHAERVAEASVQHIRDNGKAEQQRRAVLQKMYPSLVAIARRHAGYQTLYNICTDLHDMNQLRNLMRESMGLREGRFSHYVFDQLCQTKQYSKLLQFGEEFQEELEAFLQDHIHLRWLHELFMQQYTSACSTLHSLALTQTSLKDEEANFGSHALPKVKNSLKERRRLLYLAKLAALAGGDMIGGEKVQKIDGNISIIEVQESAHSKGVTSDDILQPVQLVESCLKSGQRELVMRAFDVLAYAGDNFRTSNRSLLEAAWLHAAEQDNWASMKDISEESGWSDEQYWVTLQGTVLCQMAKRCYEVGASLYGAPFQEILPLFESDRPEEDRGRISKSESASKSVEAILMQHKDFADAGEAMLTALRMGVSSENDIDEKELEFMTDS